MSTNQYANIDYRINSLLMGSNCYRSVSGEDDFKKSLVEEITAPMRQTPGRCYMQARMDGSNDALWMVPFTMGETRIHVLLDAMEKAMRYHTGSAYIRFPLDIAANETKKVLLMRPIDRNVYVPLRTYMPAIDAPRWKIASSLFRQVQQLRQMEITSNGLSREQLRVNTQNFEVTIWLNETMSLLKQSRDPGLVTRHTGFFSIPDKTEEICRRNNILIDGGQRDVFSAAVAAFYLIMYTHPFVGSTYYGLMRSQYLSLYQVDPQYIMEAGTENTPGNQMLSRAVRNQWSHTVPQLKDLFDGLFLAITHPEQHWDENAPYWDPQVWIQALDADAQANDNAESRVPFRFENEIYHMV